MAHLDENIIVAFFSPGRTNEVVARVDGHAAECEQCRTLLAEYAAIARTEKPVVTEPLAEGRPADVGDPVELVHRLAVAQATKRIGTVVKGKYEIEALLGTGGMSLVYAARHRNGRRVAIKFMRPELVLERSLVERFLREGYVANKIDHPSAVAIVDDDVAEDGTPFLVMELLSGESLRARLARGALPLADAIRITREVLDVLAIAHDKGIVHRDLKPDNLFVTESGGLKILDFGIARLKELSSRDVETRSGITMGTVGYMPPEQARGLTSEIDARSDVWAMGATLYALLSGRSLHEASTPNESLLLAMTTPAPPMREALPSLPGAVQSVLDRALAYEKGRRYANAREMNAALEAALRGMVDSDSATSPPRSAKSRPWVVVTIAGMCVVAATGGAALIARRSRISRVEPAVGLVAGVAESTEGIAPMAPVSASASASAVAASSPSTARAAPTTSASTATAATPRTTATKRVPKLAESQAAQVQVAPAHSSPSRSSAPADPLGPRF